MQAKISKKGGARRKVQGIKACFGSTSSRLTFVVCPPSFYTSRAEFYGHEMSTSLPVSL